MAHWLSSFLNIPITNDTTLKYCCHAGLPKRHEESQLKRLAGAVLAKRRNASKKVLMSKKTIPENMVLSDRNKLLIDQLLANHEPSSPEKYGARLQRKTRR